MGAPNLPQYLDEQRLLHVARWIIVGWLAVMALGGLIVLASENEGVRNSRLLIYQAIAGVITIPAWISAAILFGSAALTNAIERRWPEIGEADQAEEGPSETPLPKEWTNEENSELRTNAELRALIRQARTLKASGNSQESIAEEMDEPVKSVRWFLSHFESEYPDPPPH